MYVTEYMRAIKEMGGDGRTLEIDLPWFPNLGCLRITGAGFKWGLFGPVPDQLSLGGLHSPALQTVLRTSDVLRAPLRKPGLALEAAGFPPISPPPGTIFPELISESLCVIQALTLNSSSIYKS